MTDIPSNPPSHATDWLTIKNKRFFFYWPLSFFLFFLVYFLGWGRVFFLSFFLGRDRVLISFFFLGHYRFFFFFLFTFLVGGVFSFFFLFFLIAFLEESDYKFPPQICSSISLLVGWSVRHNFLEARSYTSRSGEEYGTPCMHTFVH